MKRIIIIAALLLCGCVKGQQDLVHKVDSCISQLNGSVYSFGLTQSGKDTIDGYYTVTPIGRLVVVRINEYVDSDEYEKLRKVLERRYKSDSRVRSVYINKKGTVVVDCRN